MRQNIFEAGGVVTILDSTNLDSSTGMWLNGASIKNRNIFGAKTDAQNPGISVVEANWCMAELVIRDFISKGRESFEFYDYLTVTQFKPKAEIIDKTSMLSKTRNIASVAGPLNQIFNLILEPLVSLPSFHFSDLVPMNKGEYKF